MTAGELGSTIGELIGLADDFAARALAQEALRDCARPGSVVQRHHAHSATLWRLAEAQLKARISALEPQARIAPPARSGQDPGASAAALIEAASVST
jgi:hypothetical protein